MKIWNHLAVAGSLSLFLYSCGDHSETTKNKQLKTGPSITDVEEKAAPNPYSYNSNFEDDARTQSTSIYHGFAEGSVTYSMTAADVSSVTPHSKKPVKKGKKIIRNGTMRIKTTTFNESKKRIDQTIKSLNGYYENEELDKNALRIQYHLVIRVPSKNFEQLVHGVESGKDEIQFKKLNVSDVTEEFLDIETRLENKRKYLERYKQLLEKAKNVNEILDIEENIRQLIEEIESKEGRLKYLNDQVDLSTLTIDLFREYPVNTYKPAEDPFSSRAGNSLSKGWNSIINFLLWVVSKWPFVILAGIAAWFVRRKWKKRKTAINQ